MLKTLARFTMSTRWMLATTVWLTTSIADAQHHHDFRGATFSNGHGAAAPGHMRVSGGAAFGPPGVTQQFGHQSPSFGAGSSSTWSNGHRSFGVGRGPSGAWNLSYNVPSVNTFTVIPPYYPSSNGGYWTDPTGYSFFPYNGVNPGWSISPYAAYGGQGSLWYRQPVPGNFWMNSYGMGGFGYSYSSNAMCYNSLPYYGGTNSYFAGSVLMPTLIAMNVNMMPSVPSTASYTVTDPRMLDTLAPPLNMQLPPGNFEVPNAPPAPQPDADLPLLNEFNPSPRSDRVSTLSDKIQSLRHQSAGDDAFRHERYDEAVTFYQSAIDAAPDRRAPWIRIAFAQIAMKRFDLAVARLKTGLGMPDDAGRSWMTGEELYGSEVASRARAHGLDLLNWLAERPTSADRLLLVGTFQQLRGHEEVASELLALSSHKGPEAAMAAAVTRLAHNDIGQRAAAHDLAELRDDANKPPVAPASETRDPNGIYLKGNP